MKLTLAASLVTSLLGASLLSGCNAPRDPELERHAFQARIKGEPREDVQVEPPPPPPVPEKTSPDRRVDAPSTLRNYRQDQQQEALSSIPGEGKSILATLETTQGVIRCRLDERAPQTLTNFIRLVQGQEPPPKEGHMVVPYYDGLTFHRIQPDFIIQTGNPTGKQGGGVSWKLARETHANELFEQAGALAMVDAEEHSHGSQFFITLRPQASMKGRYSAFGRCENLDVVKAISLGELRPSTNSRASSSPLNPVTIQKISLSRGD